MNKGTCLTTASPMPVKCHGLHEKEPLNAHGNPEVCSNISTKWRHVFPLKNDTCQTTISTCTVGLLELHHCNCCQRAISLPSIIMLARSGSFWFLWRCPWKSCYRVSHNLTFSTRWVLPFWSTSFSQLLDWRGQLRFAWSYQRMPMEMCLQVTLHMKSLSKVLLHSRRDLRCSDKHHWDICS